MGNGPHTDTLAAVASRYAVGITPEMESLIVSANDPIARQFVPTAAELVITDEERADPIGDEPYSPTRGLVHRYADRALLKALHTCPVYCRFCFRREVVGTEGALSETDLDAALRYIADTPSLWEVILTGGDPLILSARRLSSLVGRLAGIDHVKVLRVHTRVPVVSPSCINASLISALKAHPTPWVVLHTNHVRELTPAAEQAIARLVDAGIPVLSQTVLLRQVNDSPEALRALFRKLVECRVKPYYLHQGDLARGTSHHRTSLRQGRALMTALRGDLSGLCQPTYVLDIPGGHGKVPVGPNYLEKVPGGWEVTDPNGVVHHYPEPEALGGDS